MIGNHFRRCKTRILLYVGVTLWLFFFSPRFNTDFWSTTFGNTQQPIAAEKMSSKSSKKSRPPTKHSKKEKKPRLTCQCCQKSAKDEIPFCLSKGSAESNHCMQCNREVCPRCLKGGDCYICRLKKNASTNNEAALQKLKRDSLKAILKKLGLKSETLRNATPEQMIRQIVKRCDLDGSARASQPSTSFKQDEDVRQATRPSEIINPADPNSASKDQTSDNKKTTGEFPLLENIQNEDQIRQMSIPQIRSFLKYYGKFDASMNEKREFQEVAIRLWRTKMKIPINGDHNKKQSEQQQNQEQVVEIHGNHEPSEQNESMRESKKRESFTLPAEGQGGIPTVGEPIQNTQESTIFVKPLEIINDEEEICGWSTKELKAFLEKYGRYNKTWMEKSTLQYEAIKIWKTEKTKEQQRNAGKEGHISNGPQEPIEDSEVQPNICITALPHLKHDDSDDSEDDLENQRELQKRTTFHTAQEVIHEENGYARPKVVIDAIPSQTELQNEIKVDAWKTGQNEHVMLQGIPSLQMEDFQDYDNMEAFMGLQNGGSSIDKDEFYVENYTAANFAEMASASMETSDSFVYLQSLKDVDQEKARRPESLPLKTLTTKRVEFSPVAEQFSDSEDESYLQAREYIDGDAARSSFDATAGPSTFEVPMSPEEFFDTLREMENDMEDSSEFPDFKQAVRKRLSIDRSVEFPVEDASWNGYDDANQDGMHTPEEFLGTVYNIQANLTGNADLPVNRDANINITVQKLSEFVNNEEATWKSHDTYQEFDNNNQDKATVKENAGLPDNRDADISITVQKLSELVGTEEATWKSHDTWQEFDNNNQNKVNVKEDAGLSDNSDADISITAQKLSELVGTEEATWKSHVTYPEFDLNKFKEAESESGYTTNLKDSKVIDIPLIENSNEQVTKILKTKAQRPESWGVSMDEILAEENINNMKARHLKLLLHKHGINSESFEKSEMIQEVTKLWIADKQNRISLYEEAISEGGSSDESEGKISPDTEFAVCSLPPLPPPPTSDPQIIHATLKDDLRDEKDQKHDVEFRHTESLSGEPQKVMPLTDENQNEAIDIIQSESVSKIKPETPKKPPVPPPPSKSNLLGRTSSHSAYLTFVMSEEEIEYFEEYKLRAILRQAKVSLKDIWKREDLIEEVIKVWKQEQLERGRSLERSYSNSSFGLLTLNRSRRSSTESLQQEIDFDNIQSEKDLERLTSRNLQNYLLRNGVSIHGLLLHEHFLREAIKHWRSLNTKEENRPQSAKAHVQEPELLLEQMTSEKQIESLPVETIEAMLKRHGLEVRPEEQKDELVPRLKVLWRRKYINKEGHEEAAPPPPPLPRIDGRVHEGTVHLGQNREVHLNNDISFDTEEVGVRNASRKAVEEVQTTPQFEGLGPPKPKRVSKVETLQDITSPETIRKMEIRQIKALLTKHSVNFADCQERHEIVQRLETLWHDTKKHATREIQPEELCKVCMCERMDCVLLECGHVSTCTDCGHKITECPICRNFVVKVVRLYKS